MTAANRTQVWLQASEPLGRRQSGGIFHLEVLTEPEQALLIGADPLHATLGIGRIFHRRMLMPLSTLNMWQ